MKLPSKQVMINALHRLYRTDPWINEIFSAIGIELDEVEKELDRIYNDEFFDTLSEKAVLRYEKLLAITPKFGQTLENRRSIIRAKWIGSGKVTLAMMQEVANSWKNGAIALEFIGGRIHVKFISPVGVPENLADLQEALENVKPAHLAIYFTFMYLTWGDLLGSTWGEAKQRDWKHVKQEDI